ncbi:MAG: 1-(5-phosphoribosyl)-5-[(5-phosphoribosylamino)methylideneamino]imidazole-4-carboxamide isomerase [bacterium]|nr:1-(5-phosphoribosyl)-5-[(5-phosphoribosylamino)methylideneamino]imidazole-4-carboxamide isomerase [bacterium]
MIIYPAIDLRGGQVVRLQGGDPNAQTTFSADPFATAQKWQQAGATWLHMVNLDGAFGEKNGNLAILEKVATTGLHIQFGGGIRSLEDVETALKLGAKRVVIGTLAVQQPDLIRTAVAQFGAEAICVGIDGRDQFVMTHGWKEKSPYTIFDFGRMMAERGAIHALFTDVSRDGHLGGVNFADTVALGEQSGLQVIASGGVNSLDNVRELAQSKVIGGAIIGMALYKSIFTLQEALEAVKNVG